MAKSREKIWIADEEFKTSPNQMYRAYIFNFQEDMWNYIYKGRDHGTDGRDKAAKEFFAVMKGNAKQFDKHLKKPEDTDVVNEHVQLIETWMNSLLDNFKTKKDKGSVFYRAVQRVHNEFGM